MGRRSFSEKQQCIVVGGPKRSGQIAIIMSQHVLLGAAVFVVGSTVFSLACGQRTTVELPTAVLMIASVCLTHFRVRSNIDLRYGRVWLRLRASGFRTPLHTAVHRHFKLQQQGIALYTNSSRHTL